MNQILKGEAINIVEYMSIINELDFDNSKLSVGLMNSLDKDVR